MDEEEKKMLEKLKYVLDGARAVQRTEFMMTITGNVIRTLLKLADGGNGLAKAILSALPHSGNYVAIDEEAIHSIFRTLLEMQDILVKTSEQAKIIGKTFLGKNYNENNN